MLVTSLGLFTRLNFNKWAMFVSASEAGGYPVGFGVGCALQKSKIAENLEYLTRTVKCLHSILIN